MFVLVLRSHVSTSRKAAFLVWLTVIGDPPRRRSKYSCFGLRESMTRFMTIDRAPTLRVRGLFVSLSPFNPRCKRDLVGLVITASLLVIES